MPDYATRIRLEIKRITRPGKGTSTDDLIEAIGTVMDRPASDIARKKAEEA